MKSKKEKRPSPSPPQDAAPPTSFSWDALLPVPTRPGWYIGPYFPATPTGVWRFLTQAKDLSPIVTVPPHLLVSGQAWHYQRKQGEYTPYVYEYVTEPELSRRRRETHRYIRDMVEALGTHLSIERVSPGPWRGGIEKSLPRGDRDA